MRLKIVGTDDCGDHSDEINCPSRVPRRIVTAAVIGATVCSTLFIIALGCTCKLFHLRTAERRAASRLLNPQRYIEQRRQQLQQEQQRRVTRQNRREGSTTIDPACAVSGDSRRIAPPSYNQTMGLMDENEERHAALAEHLRLAGLANYITLPAAHSSSRTSRSASRHRHRRHRRHRHHHHHHRRAHSEGSRVALLEPSVVVSDAAFPVPSTTFSVGRLGRIRSQLRSLFTTNPTTNAPNHLVSIQSNPPVRQFDIYERHHTPMPTATQPIVLTARPHLNSDFIHPRELPPPYSEEQSTPSHTTVHALSTGPSSSRRSSSGGSDMESTHPTTTSASLYRLRKRQMPINTLRDRMRQFISGSAGRITADAMNHPMQPTTTTTNASLALDMHSDEVTPAASMEDEEQPCSDDDDKLLTP